MTRLERRLFFYRPLTVNLMLLGGVSALIINMSFVTETGGNRALAQSEFTSDSFSTHMSAPGPVEMACPVGAVRVVPGEYIQAAVNRSATGAIICIAAGRYRAQTIAPKDGQRFYGENGAVMDGAVETSDFYQEGLTWVAADKLPPVLPYGFCRSTFPSCRFPEAVWLDGEQLTRVLARQDLRAGHFFIDDNRRLMLSNNPKRHRIEVSTTPSAFQSNGARDVTVANLVVERYASLAQHGAIYNQHDRRASGWTVVHNMVRLNSGLGILAGPSARIIANRVERNGQLGVSASFENGQIEGNEIEGNNTRGFDPAWEAGGVKAAAATGLILRGNDVHHNHGPGLWCDIDCRDISYEENLVTYNDGPGVFHEISFKATISRNIVAFNGVTERDWYWGANILLAASQGVTVEDNQVSVANGGTGIALVDQGRPRKAGGFYMTAENLIRRNNVRFEGFATAHMGGVSDVNPGSPNYGVIENAGNLFQNNNYFVPSTTQVEFGWGRNNFDFAAFQALGQERGSIFHVEGS